MPFAKNSLNSFAAGTYDIPDKMCSHFMMRRARNALGLAYEDVTKQQIERQNNPNADNAKTNNTKSDPKISKKINSEQLNSEQPNSNQLNSNQTITQKSSSTTDSSEVSKQSPDPKQSLDENKSTISTILSEAEKMKDSLVFSGKFEEGFKKCRENIKKPSILVVGGTGVGKSTLVNLLLKKEVAVEGSGKPVNYYSNELINIYDSEGYEIGSENQERINNLIFNFIDEKSLQVETSINVILYCISGPSARITDTDINFMNNLKQKNIPFALVVTQIDVATEEQCDNIKNIALENIKDLEIFESYNEALVDEPIPVEKGLDELNTWVVDVLPDSLRFAYLSVSNRNLEQKFSEGTTIIYQHIAISFTTGFSPIPISDAPILFANQMGMIARLASLWDLGSIQTVITSGLLEPVLSTIGKTIAGNIIKMIPGIGTLVGGTINGAVGAALTYGLGQAINVTCKKICEAQLEGKDISIPEFFDTDFIDLVRVNFQEFKSSNKFSSLIDKINIFK